MNENCPVCKRKLMDAPGIGPFCANKKCKVFDDTDLFDQEGNLIREPYVLLHKRHPEAVSVTVLIGPGADLVMIKYNAESPIWPFEDNELSMKFEAAKGRGVEYVREVFGMEPKVIQT